MVYERGYRWGVKRGLVRLGGLGFVYVFVGCGDYYWG